MIFVSLEMSAEELGARMAADLTFDGQGGVPYCAFTNANANGTVRPSEIRQSRVPSSSTA